MLDEVEEEDSLFDLGDIAEITTSRRPDSLRAAWLTWVALTDRPESKKAEREFGTLLRGLNPRMLDHYLQLAARMPPRPRDPLDLRRLRMVIENVKARAVAQAALTAGGPLQPYPAQTARGTLDGLERALGTSQRDWQRRQDLDAAAELVLRYTDEELTTRAESAALRSGLSELFPSDLLRYKAETGGRRHAVARAERSTYVGGETEAALLAGVDVDADEEASRRLVRGRPPIEVAAFHAQAPAGYWAAVSALLRDMEHDEAYEELREPFNWHPEMRT